MLGLGAVDNHGNSHEFGDIMDQTSEFSIGFWLKQNTTNGATFRTIVFKGSGASNWVIQVNTTQKPVLTISGVADAAANTSFDTTVRSYIAAFDVAGNVVNWYRDGVADGTPAQAGNPSVSAANLTIGSTDAAANGYACNIGQVMIWPGVVISATEAAAYHAGNHVQRSALGFWHRGTATPGVDEVGGTAPTVNGTVTLVSAAIPDAYYQEPGGFAVFAGSWAPLLLPAAGMFGSYLRSHIRSSSLPRLWRELQRIARCRIVGATEEEVVSVFDMLRRRPHVFMGSY